MGISDLAKRFRFLILSAAFLSIVIMPLGAHAIKVMPQAALTNDAVTKMATAGLGEEVILSMVNTQPGKYSTTPDDLINLKKAGVSDTIIAAMVKKNVVGMETESMDSKAPPADTELLDGLALPADIGVYFKKNVGWVEVMPEIVTWKTGGIFKNIASAGIVKGDVNGLVPGVHSRNSVLTPLEFFIRTSEGVAITEYQLLRLREKKNEREFRMVTGGVLHVSGGAARDLVPFEGKRVGSRAFLVVLPNLGAGEYGFMPPGAIMSGSSASVGRMFTFRVVE